MGINDNAAGIAKNAADEVLGLLIANTDTTDFFQFPAHLGFAENIKAFFADAREDIEDGLPRDLPPVGRDGDPAFGVEGMFELPDEDATVEKRRGRGCCLRVHGDTQLTHFIPL